MNLIKLGTQYYIKNEGKYHSLSYAQYLTFCDVESGRIINTKEAIQERLNHYEWLHSKVECPLCDNGLITVDMSLDPELECYHDELVHYHE